MGGSSPYKSGDEAGMGVLPTGAPTTTSGPQTITAPTTPYSPGPYTTPTYALTPQSGYTGLAQQLQQSFALSPQSYAAPRTGLFDMYASPWSKLYGGPAMPTFADYFGQDPMQGRAPPPGTPGYQGTGTNVPPPPPPPTGGPGGMPPGSPPPPPGSPPPGPIRPPGTPPPPGPPGSYDNGAPYPGGAPKVIPRWEPQNRGLKGLPTAPVGAGLYSDANQLSSPAGTLLNDMRAQGLSGGAGALMMASGRNAMSRSLGLPALDNNALIDASRQGVNPRDMGMLSYDRGGRKWMRGGKPYVSPGNTFNYGQYPQGRK